jgi:hypothetical protein
MISGTHPGIELEGEGVTLDALRLADSSPAPGEYPITEEIPGELEAIASIPIECGNDELEGDRG